ncbi:MAG: DUF3343 domain-containing protein [Smithellaceae bacterium]|jgi:hypothetical protein|nr:DUF3343 domain-containing protein [Syntrophaceae bacterium]MDD4241050.1 DUF3343 domain-containing protein [Smithellaceae bacterium]
MAASETHAVILFESVSHALHAEKLLKAAGVKCKLIPVPRHLSSDCGVCLRIDGADRDRAAGVLTDRLDYFDIALL